MKLLLTLPLLAVLSLPGCTVVQSARDKLAEMPEDQYKVLVTDVRDASKLAGLKLAESFNEDQKLSAIKLTMLLGMSVEADALNVNDVVQHILNEYAENLGLKPEHIDYIRDGAKIIDVAVGQVRLGIDGKLTPREKQLVLALLGGLHSGLAQ